MEKGEFGKRIDARGLLNDKYYVFREDAVKYAKEKIGDSITRLNKRLAIEDEWFENNKFCLGEQQINKLAEALVRDICHEADGFLNAYIVDDIDFTIDKMGENLESSVLENNISGYYRLKCSAAKGKSSADRALFVIWAEVELLLRKRLMHILKAILEGNESFGVAFPISDFRQDNNGELVWSGWGGDCVVDDFGISCLKEVVGYCDREKKYKPIGGFRYVYSELLKVLFQFYTSKAIKNYKFLYDFLVREEVYAGLEFMYSPVCSKIAGCVGFDIEEFRRTNNIIPSYEKAIEFHNKAHKGNNRIKEMTGGAAELLIEVSGFNTAEGGEKISIADKIVRETTLEHYGKEWNMIGLGLEEVYKISSLKKEYKVRPMEFFYIVDFMHSSFETTALQEAEFNKYY